MLSRASKLVRCLVTDLSSSIQGIAAPVAASRVVQTSAYDVDQATNIKWHETMVTRSDKERILNQKGCVLWFTGLSGSGKSTVACTLEHALASQGKTTVQPCQI